MWENVVERGRLQMVIWRMRIACWIPKATNTHSQYVIHIAFPLQHWLYERLSILRRTYFGCHAVTETPCGANWTFQHDARHHQYLRHCNTFFFGYLGLFPVDIFLKLLRTRPHLHVAFTRRTNGRSLATFQGTALIRISTNIGQNISLT